MAEKPRVAVVFRTFFWDDFARRAALRVQARSHGMDFYVEVNETEAGFVDVSPFQKIAASVSGFEALGLPCLSSKGTPPLWWNCDYGLYGAALAHPGYDYYFLIEYDVAVNVALCPLVEQVASENLDCVTCFEHYAMRETWGYARFSAGMPYARKAWTPLCMMLATEQVALRLLSERQRLARMYASGEMAEWPISEGFFSSALLDAGFSSATLRQFTHLPHFSTEAIFLEGDARTTLGGFSHAVLDAERFWQKFVDRSFWSMLATNDHNRLRLTRDELIRTGRTVHGTWRIATEPGNLALDRPARQSSCSAWSRKPRSAEVDPNALDASGGNCGVLTGSWCFHTAEEDSPWWAVDLGQASRIGEIRVYHPLALPDRTRGLLLEVSSDGTNWNVVHRKPDYHLFGGKDDPLACRLPPGTTARHVRVRLAQPGILHLDEVEVYGSTAAGG